MEPALSYLLFHTETDQRGAALGNPWILTFSHANLTGPTTIYPLKNGR